MGEERNTNLDGKFNLRSDGASLKVPASIEDLSGLRPVSSRIPVKTYENLFLFDCSAWIVFRFVLREPLAAAVSRAAVGLTLNPSSVSNTYSGTITLQVTGLAVGDTVVVQEFLDANTKRRH